MTDAITDASRELYERAYESQFLLALSYRVLADARKRNGQSASDLEQSARECAREAERLREVVSR